MCSMKLTCNVRHDCISPCSAVAPSDCSPKKPEFVVVSVNCKEDFQEWPETCVFFDQHISHLPGDYLR